MAGKLGSNRTHRCPEDHKHGKTGTCYNMHGCGCENCVDARRNYQLARYRKRAYGTWKPNKIIDGLGTRRRLRALAYMGWSAPQIGAELGVVYTFVVHLWDAERVSAETARTVAEVYKRIWTLEPPGGRRKRTADRARRMGWHGPLAWDDIDRDPEPVVVERDLRRAAWVLEEIEWLRDAGESPVAVAGALKRSPDSMARLAYRNDRPDIAAWIHPKVAAA